MKPQILLRGEAIVKRLILKHQANALPHFIWVRNNVEAALHKKSWAVIDRPYSLGCATVGALYERPRCIFCAKPMQREATRAFPRFVKKSKDDFSDLRGVKFSRRFRTSTATTDAACAGLQSPTAGRRFLL